MTVKGKSAPFLVLGIIAFGGFMGELLLAIFEMSVLKIEFGAMTLFETYRHWVITYIIWASFAYVLHRIAKAKYGFEMYSFKGEVSVKSWLTILAMCSLHILYATYDWGWRIKPYVEYLNWEADYPGSGIYAFAMQLVYYFFEGLLMMVIVAFGQEFGERKFKNKSIPWGGILLAVTWGMMHWITKFSLSTAISCSVIAVYFGVCYLLLKKNAVYSWLLFFVVYTL